MGPEERVVLLIEDLRDDVVLIQRALSKAKVRCMVKVANDGEEAIAYLAGEGDFADRETYPVPHLALLDLKLPRKNGFEVLSWIRQNKHLHSIPVVVLTSSKTVEDIEKAYDLGANSYLVKPIVPQDMQMLCKSLGLYWLDLNIFPGTETAESE